MQPAAGGRGPRRFPLDTIQPQCHAANSIDPGGLDLDSVTVPLSSPARLAVDRIKAAGFADDDVGAIRVAVADFATRLQATPTFVVAGAQEASASSASAATVLRDGHSPDTRRAASEALRIVRSEECTCRSSTGRHHVLMSLLGALNEDGAANWLAVLEAAQVSASRYNERLGWSKDVAPASVAYNPAAMSQNWMRAYIAEGAGRFKERYSKSGPSVRTAATATGRGVEIRLD